MNEASLLESLGQVSASGTGQIFGDFLRGYVRERICEVMAAEVTELCGPKYTPSKSTYYRAGSSPGRVLYQGEREDVVHPWGRRKSAEGGEVELASRIANDPEQLRSQILQAIVSAASSRGFAEIKPNSPGVKRSDVSRLWQKTGCKFVSELRSKDLTQTNWCVLMFDGIRLSKEQTAVVALGIDSEGHKHVLDFALGSSESLEVSRVN